MSTGKQKNKRHRETNRYCALLEKKKKRTIYNIARYKLLDSSREDKTRAQTTAAGSPAVVVRNSRVVVFIVLEFYRAPTRKLSSVSIRSVAHVRRVKAVGQAPIKIRDGSW